MSSQSNRPDGIDKLTAEAKLSLVQCEQEISLIKQALRNLGEPSDDELPNSLTITWIKVRHYTLC